MEKIKLSIVIPIYNSEPTIGELTSRLLAAASQLEVETEIIFVCDGSPDKSWEKISLLASAHSEVRGIKLSRNFGQHKAIMAGLRLSEGEWVVVMDADLQDTPERIGELYTTAIRDGSDCVIAVRSGESKFDLKRLTSALFYKFFRQFTGLGTRPGVGNFGIYSRNIINQVTGYQDQNFLFPALVQSCHPRVTHLEIRREPRLAGKSSYSARRRLNLAIDALVWNSNGALKIALIFGLLFSMGGFITGAFIIADRISKEPVIPGWTSVIVAILLGNGITLFALGTVGIYIGKIFDFTKARPIYVVETDTRE